MSETRTLELDRETVVRLRDAGKQHVHQLESAGEIEWAENVDEAVQKLLWQWNKHSVQVEQ